MTEQVIDGVGINVTAITAGEKVLRHFWDLASLDEEARLRAASLLVEDLKAAQGGPESGQKPQELEDFTKAPKAEAALQNCSDLTLYSLKRLVRGLASSRQAARQGFALALTMLLSSIDAVSAQGALDLIEANLQSSKSQKGSDAREAALGRIFGYSAIIRSGRASQDSALAVQLVSSLLALLQSKSFLAEVSAASLLELSEQLDDTSFSAILKAVPGLAEMLQSSPESASPEALLLALHLWSRCNSELLAKCPLLPSGAQPPVKGFFTSTTAEAADHPVAAAEAFFAASHLQKILMPLRLSSASHPRLHSLWPTLFALLVPGFTAAKASPDGGKAKGSPGLGQLEGFWRIVAEDDLLNSSHERKYLAFQLFNLLLPFLGPNQIPVALSPKFQQTLVNSLAQQDRILHMAAKKVVARISAFAEKYVGSPGMRVALAVALQSKGGGNFDRQTRTKTVAHLLQSMDGSSIQLYIKHLKGIFAAPPSTETSAIQGGEIEGNAANSTASGPERTRAWVVEQLAGVCSLEATSESSMHLAVHYLALQAFFEVDGSATKARELRAAAKISPPPSEATRKLCAARLMTLVEKAGKAHKHLEPEKPRGGNQRVKQALPGPPGSGQPVTAAPKPAGKDATNPANDQAKHVRRGENAMLKEVVDYFRSMYGSPGVTLVVELSEPILAAVSTLQSVEAKASKALAKASKEEQAKGNRADQLLAFLQLVRWLQLYIIGDAENAEPELADELLSIYKAAFRKEKGSSTGELEYMDRLVDVALSLLAYSSAELPSVPLREAIEALFKAFASQLTQTGLHDLVRVISRPDKPPQDEDEEVLADEDEVEDETDGDDVEDEAEEGDSDTEMTDAAALEAGVDEEAERPQGMDIDNGVPSTSDRDSDDDNMTDEQMFKMDKLLAAVLRTQKEAKDKSKNTKQALQNFKLRTLALLEVYSKAVPGSSFLAGVLADLVRAVEAAGKSGVAKNVAERIRGVISKLCRSKPDQAAAQSIDPKTILSGAKAVHLLAARNASGQKLLRPACDTALHYYLSLATTAGTEEHLAVAAAICKRINDDFFCRRDLKVPQQLVLDLAKRYAQMAAVLLPDIAKHLGTARTAFLQSQAASMLASMVKPSQGDKLISEIAKELLPILSASSAAVIQGHQFTGAAKHAEALKNLASVWEALGKALSQDFAESLRGQDKQMVEQACHATHQTAATAKIGIAVARICRAVGGSDLGQPDLDGPLREYKKAEQPANVREQGKQTLTKAAAEGQAARHTGDKNRKQNHASADLEVKAAKKGGKAAKKARVEAVQEPEIVIIDELQEAGPEIAQPKKKKKKKSSSHKKDKAN